MPSIFGEAVEHLEMIYYVAVYTLSHCFSIDAHSNSGQSLAAEWFEMFDPKGMVGRVWTKSTPSWGPYFWEPVPFASIRNA